MMASFDEYLMTVIAEAVREVCSQTLNPLAAARQRAWLGWIDGTIMAA